MRISTGYQFETYKSQIGITSSQLFEAQQQVSTGKRIFKASDDPIGVRSVISYRSLKSGIEQYSKNLEMAKGYLGYTEGALTETSQVLNRAYELAMRGANTSTDQTGREAMVFEVVELQRRLTNLANSQGPHGEYLFAGQDYTSTPFSLVGTALVYSGDNNDLKVEIAPGETMTMNVQGGALYTDLYQKLEDLKNNLQGGNIGALSGVSVPDLQAVTGQVNRLRGSVGSKVQSIETMTENYLRRTDDFTREISDVEEIDLTQAILKYKQAESAYTAALQIATEGYRLSLMDFIRG